MLEPQLVERDCQHCLAHLYDEKTGKLEFHHGRPIKRQGPAPCRTPGGCPKGTAENPIVLWPRHYATLAHYDQCKAVGRFPDDPIVLRNAAIIHAIEEAIVVKTQQANQQMMLAMIGGK